MTLTATTFQFNPVNVQNIPFSQGVYELSDFKYEVIYIGRTDNLNSRLQQHLSTSDACMKDAKYFRYDETWNSERREKELLEEFRRKYGHLPRCNDRIG